MGFEYSTVRQASFRPATPVTASYRVLPFPELVRANLLGLCNLGLADGREPYRTVPTRRLNDMLRCLAADVVVMNRPNRELDPETDHWLYVPADRPPPLPDDVLSRLLGVWLHDLRPERQHQKAVQDVFAELMANPPQWQDISLPLLHTDRSPGGTAQPHHRQYRLIADHFARRVQALGPYDTGAGQLVFQAVATGVLDSGVELMSQPLPFEEKGKQWWFSARITFSVHTVPFAPEPRLHVHLGIRRWLTHPSVKTGRLWLPSDTDTSVYLRPIVPWLPGAPNSDRYTVARLTWDREARAHRWRHGDAAGMLRRIALNQPFPDVDRLLTNPVDWLGNERATRALVVHNTRRGEHGVGAGFMSHQRSQIVDWIRPALAPDLELVPDLTRSRLAPNLVVNARLKSDGETEAVTAAARRAALARLGSPLIIETEGETPAIEVRLLWQTEEMRSAAITALTVVLGLDGDGGAQSLLLAGAFDAGGPGHPAVLTWRTRELVVRLRCLKLVDGLADSLGVSSRSGRVAAALAEGLRTRRAAAAKFLTADGASTAAPSLAFVELDRRADFPKPRDDPKFALRLGFAGAGAVTQFALVPKVARGYNSRRNIDHRARSSWEDGLRQLGVRTVPRHTLGDRVPADLQYLALWMVDRRRDNKTGLARRLLTAVLVRPDARVPGTASILGWDAEADAGVGAWVPYPRLLVRLTELAEVTAEDLEETSDGRPTWRARRRNEEEQRQETSRFLQKLLYSADVRGQPTVVLCHSQNLRRQWRWLQDGVMIKDLTRTGHAPAAAPNPELGLIRVRTDGGKETPEWWGTGSPTGVNGLPAGFWTPTEPDRVFYSTTEKACTFKASAVEADKLAPRPLRAGPRKGEPTVDTAVPAWNPTLVEIVVAACHPEQGDDPEALAFAVHQQRQAPDYSDALLLPLPLHLAKLAQHYVLPTASDDVEGEST